MASTTNVDGTAKKRSIVAGVSWLTLSQIARSATSFAVTAVLARVLSPMDFGLMALVTMSTGIVGVFGDIGLATALVQRSQIRQEQMATAFWLGLAVATGLAALGAVFSPLVASTFHEPRITVPIMVALLTIPLGAIGHVSDAVLHRQLAFRELAIIDWLSTLAAGTISILLALAGFGVWALVAQFVATGATTSIGRLITAGWLPGLQFRLSAVKGLVAFGMAVLAAMIINFLFRKVDNFLVGKTFGSETLGYYNLAYNLMLLPSVTVGGVLLKVLFPVLSSQQGDLAQFRRTYVRAIRVLAAGTLPLVIGLGVTAPLAVRVVYGEQWIPAIKLLQLLAVVGVLEAVNTSGVVFFSVGRPQLSVAWAAISLVMLTIALTLGIHFGIGGLVWAYVIIAPVLYGAPHLLANRLIGLSASVFGRSIAPPVLAALGMGGSILLLMPLIADRISSKAVALGTCVGLGAVIYALALAGMAMVRGRRGTGIISWVVGKPELTDVTDAGMQQSA